MLSGEGRRGGDSIAMRAAEGPRREAASREHPTRATHPPRVRASLIRASTHAPRPSAPRAPATDAAAASWRGAVGRTERSTCQGMAGRAQAGGAAGRVGCGSAPAKRGNGAEGGRADGPAGERARESRETGRVARAGWARLSLLLSAVRGRGSCRRADGCASGGRGVACWRAGSLRAASMRGAQAASPSTPAPPCPSPTPAPPPARHLVRRVDVGLVLEQQPHHRLVTVLGSHDQARGSDLPRPGSVR